VRRPAKVAPPGEPAKVEPATEPEPVKKVAHVAKSKPRPKPQPPTPKPEEKPWNADSPFMPVRTDKH
jgi:hypothetical protein